MPRAFAPNSVLVVSVLGTDHIPGAWPAIRLERVVLVGQIVQLLVRRELARRQNLLIPETAQGVVLEIMIVFALALLLIIVPVVGFVLAFVVVVPSRARSGSYG